MKRYLLLLSALLTLPAVAAPTLVDLHYALSHNGLAVATMHDTFQRTGKQYRIVSTTAASGVIGVFYKGTLTSTSAGLIGPRGLRPLRFEQTRSDAQDKNIGARFDWKTSKLTLLDKGRSETVALPPGTQDRLSVLYQFMFVKPGEATLKFDVATGHSLSPDTYTLVGRGWLVAPLRVRMLRALFSSLYRKFALHRYRISGWLGLSVPPRCQDGVCPLHPFHGPR